MWVSGGGGGGGVQAPGRFPEGLIVLAAMKRPDAVYHHHNIAVAPEFPRIFLVYVRLVWWFAGRG